MFLLYRHTIFDEAKEKANSRKYKTEEARQMAYLQFVKNQFGKVASHAQSL